MHAWETNRGCPNLDFSPQQNSTIVRVTDFGSFGLAASKRVAAELDALEVGVLVNNVGISYAFPQWFHELTDDEVQSMMTINLESVVWMTRAVLPGMLQRKRGAVVNMSSASARPPLPLLAVYASTKGFVENLTKAMAHEYAHTGVSFQCQSPLYVATSIVFPNSKVAVEKRATLSTPTAATYARCAVARIGYDVMTSPCARADAPTASLAACRVVRGRRRRLRGRK